MRIEYISHACAVIDTGDLRIVTDPWWNGPAYCGKWFVFPRPVDTSFVDYTDVLLISHGHEDHLHEETLKLFPRDVKVLYPYSFFGGAKEYIEGLGFTDVREAVTFKKYRLSDKTSVTFLINGHDSIMVIEADGKVMVNANDAMHSYPVRVIDYYVDAIKERWGKVDVLFCGFGGASYFPNTLHFKGKDDRAIGLVREQLFAHNFCRVVEGLRPEVAVPFAADFCLLTESQRWINSARFPRRKLQEYYDEHFHDGGPRPRIIDMYSGDVLEDGQLIPSSSYRAKMSEGRLRHLIEEQYAEELAASAAERLIDEAHAERLVSAIKTNADNRMTLYKKKDLKDLVFTVRLTDVEKMSFYNISFDGSAFVVVRGDGPAAGSLLTMEMPSHLLEYSIASDWGADVITSGYGAEIYFADDRGAEVEHERICMNLLARYPTPTDLAKTPFRTLTFLLLNPPKFTRKIRRLRKYSHEGEIYDRETWMLRTPEQIREVYGLPKLSDRFFE